MADEPFITALLSYEQADEEGIMVRVSRQAIHETVDKLKRLEAALAQLQENIENANMAASETQPSWKHRCFRIMDALGCNYGDPDWMMPDDRKKLELAEAEIERLTAALATSNANCDRMSNLAIDNAKDMLRMWRALEWIDQQRYTDRSTINPDNAFEKAGQLNAKLVAIMDHARAALPEKKP